MINTNKRWLLTASPWMKHGLGLSPLGIKGIFLIAIMVLTCQAGFAQNNHFNNVSNGLSNLPTGFTGGAPMLPAITGTTLFCLPTAPVTLLNGTPGGTWTSSNTAVATINSSTGLLTPLHGGVTIVTYTVGVSSTTKTITVNYPITGPTGVCLGNSINLTDTMTTGIWTSSNPSVATIDPTGLLTGILTGTTTVTYGRTGGCTVSSVITVGTNAVPNINGMGPLAVCQPGTLTATDATLGGTWTSSTPAVATIDIASGLITSVAAGATTITYTVGGCYKTKAAIVTALTSIAVITPATPSVCVGSTTALADLTPLGTWSSLTPGIATVNTGGVVAGITTGTVTVNYAKNGCVRSTVVTVNVNSVSAITGGPNVCIGTPLTLSSAPALGTWTSSNVGVAVVGSGSGIVTSAAGITGGTAIITYTQGGCFKTTTLNFNPATSVGAISGGATGVCQGATTTLTDPVPGGTWTSTTPAVATINAYGLVTGISNGTSDITYSRLGCVAIKTVTINIIPNAIGGTLNVCAGLTTTLTDATLLGTWSSSDVTKGTIDASTGVVTGIAPGNTTITYTQTGCSVTAAFTVKGPAPISGGSIDCIAPLTYLYLSDATFGGTWSTSDATVATINASTGAVTGVAGGTVTMTYTQTSTGCYATKAVTVNYAPGNIAGNTVTCAGATTTLTDTMAGGTWTSGTPTVATIGSATGIVMGLATGGTIITYTKNGCNQYVNVLVSPSVNAIAGPGSVCAGWATIQLTDATTGGIWTTTSPYIYVNPTGLVTGGSNVTGMVTTGVVNYTVGGCTVSTTITVNPNPVGSTAGIPEVCKGSSTTLINPTTGGGTWSSQYTSIATVGSGTGLVTGISHGTSAITFTIAGGCFKVFLMSVNDTAMPITGSWNVCANGTTQLAGETGIPGAWISSNSTIVTVDTTGLVTGVSAGVATITFARYGGCETYHNITSVAPPAAIGGAGSVCIGGTTITATESVSAALGTWNSSDLSVLTITGTGSPVTLNGLMAGSAILTFTAGAAGNNCFVTKTVSVNATTPAAITGNTNVCVGGVTTLANATSGGSWSSATTAKASIGAATGLVVGVATGTTLIDYTYIGCWVQTTVNVLAYTAGGVSGSSLVCVGDATTISNTVSGTWTSGNTAIATVGTATGTTTLVTGVAAGSAAITFTDASNCTNFFTTSVISTTLPAITGTTSMCVGLNTSLSNSLSGGTWTSVTPANATIDASTGFVAGLAAGTSVISYSVPGCLSFPVTTTVNVLPVPNAMTGFTTGSTLKLCESAGGSLAEAVTTGGTWTIADVAIGSISSATGTPITVTGVSAGTTYLTYTMPNGCFVSGTISVGHPPLAITGSPVCVGDFVTFSDATPGGTWSSTATSKAIVDPTFGIVSGNAAGATIIQYTTPGCGPVSYPITVNAAPGAITGATTVCKLSTTTLADTTAGGTWASSNTAVATIGTDGVVTGVAGGSVTISYTVPSGCLQTYAFVVDPCGLRNGNQPAANVPAEQAYTLFPNPSNGNFTINQAIPEDGTMNVAVMNYIGEKVFAGSVDFIGGRVSLNLSVTPGMYLVVLQDNKGKMETFKVLIEK